MLSKKQTYIFISVLAFGGYVWAGIHLLPEQRTWELSSICLFKNISGIPCPSCGTTTSLLLLLKGQWMGALHVNPLGYLSAISLLVVPLLLLYDLLFVKNHTYTLFREFENTLKRKSWISLPLILMILLNWSWNIIKSL